jgi:hypothetical protein
MTLIEAASRGNVVEVKRLLDAGADPCAWDSCALRWAAEYGNAEVVRMLLDAGADPRAEDSLALRWAAQYGHADILRMLLGAGADPRAKDSYALRFAAENGHAEVVRMLLDAGADPRAKDSEALRWAAEKGHAEVVRMLEVAMTTAETAPAMIRRALTDNDLQLVIALAPKLDPTAAAKLLSDVLRREISGRAAVARALADRAGPEATLVLALKADEWSLVHPALDAGAIGAGLSPRLQAKLAPTLRLRKAKAEARDPRGALLEVDKPRRRGKTKPEPREVPERFRLLEVDEPGPKHALPEDPRRPREVPERFRLLQVDEPKHALPEDPRRPREVPERFRLLELDGLPEATPSALPALALLTWASIRLWRDHHNGAELSQPAIGGLLLALAMLFGK